jgi:hypothetical protein
MNRRKFKNKPIPNDIEKQINVLQDKHRARNWKFTREDLDPSSPKNIEMEKMIKAVEDLWILFS